ncbi:MAG TPA: hypothetical protein VEK08_26845 [Planctomycetota bacterium]|nr:hypothetical protein [Planctomycetota bacterium]
MGSKTVVPHCNTLADSIVEPPPMRNVFVVGTIGAGKTTFARHLAGELQRPCVEVSDRLIEMMAGIYAEEHGQQRSVAECALLISGNKEAHRGALRALGNIVTTLNGGYLIRKAIHQANTQFCVVTGVRRQIEVAGHYYLALTPNDDHNLDCLRLEKRAYGDVWIFIEKPGVGLSTDSFDRGFFERFCDHHIVNKGTAEDLAQQARTLAYRLRGGKESAQ